MAQAHVYAYLYRKKEGGREEFFAIPSWRGDNWTVPSEQIEIGVTPREAFRSLVRRFGNLRLEQDPNKPRVPVCFEPEVGAVGHSMYDRDALYLILTAEVPVDWKTSEEGVWIEKGSEPSKPLAPVVSRYLYSDRGQISDDKHWSFRVN